MALPSFFAFYLQTADPEKSKHEGIYDLPRSECNIRGMKQTSK
jgi:hypothetical protein